MASMPGFEPGPHWWEASALTNALIPLSGIVHKEKKVVGTPLARKSTVSKMT